MLSASMVAPGMKICNAAGYVVFTDACSPLVSRAVANRCKW
jgi:hypothetical protein